MNKAHYITWTVVERFDEIPKRVTNAEHYIMWIVVEKMSTYFNHWFKICEYKKWGVL